MTFADRYAEWFKRLLPGPFTIAVLLTFLTFVLAFLFSSSSARDTQSFINLVSYWEGGLWDRGLLVFALQMMLMLVLGHVLALTRPVEKLIDKALVICTDTPRSALMVTLLTIIVAYFNWGLGLIFGAIFARKVAEHATNQNISLNYPLIGAAGYSGLMVWHGGFSGSSLVKVAEKGHLAELMSGVYSPDQIAALPEFIPFDDTVFSNMNMVVFLLSVIFLPLSMYYLARNSEDRSFRVPYRKWQYEKELNVEGADTLNYSRVLGISFSVLIFLGILVRIFQSGSAGFSFITPDFINLVLFFLGIALHGNFHRFIAAVDEAIKGASGILIQFPIYFGIMGIMKGSGMVEDLSNFFISISNEYTFPLFTFISAGIVNIFVPSGGGQWAVQGPIIVQTAEAMNISLPKCIMALAYGDQLTNMLQPFWALPLLGITGLKAKEILPYTLFLMAVGFIIYFSALMIF